MFWLTKVLFHPEITVLNLHWSYSSALQYAFFKSYSGPLLLILPNTVFECLHSIPCFRSTFRISAWLILLTIFFSITYPTKTRNDHVENFNPSFLGLVEAIRTISFSISSVIFGAV